MSAVHSAAPTTSKQQSKDGFGKLNKPREKGTASTHSLEQVQLQKMNHTVPPSCLVDPCLAEIVTLYLSGEHC